MLFSRKKMLLFSMYYVLFVSIFSHPFLARSSPGFTTDEINKNAEIKKKICLNIISKKENINYLQAQLRKKHSEAATELWQNYNHSTSLPTSDELSSMNIHPDITEGEKIDGKFRKWFKTFVGKKSQTCFDAETINNIKVYISEAIHKGSMQLEFNKMVLKNKPDLPDLIVTLYNYGKRLGTLYEKNDDGEISNQDKNELKIIMDADQYLRALEEDKEALNKNKIFQGKIVTIF